MQQGPVAPIINMWQEARMLYGRFKLEKERNLSDSVTAAEIILIFLLRWDHRKKLNNMQTCGVESHPACLWEMNLFKTWDTAIENHLPG